MNLCPRHRLKALGIFLRPTLGLRPRVRLRKIPWAFNLALGHRITWLPPWLVHRLSQASARLPGNRNRFILGFYNFFHCQANNQISHFSSEKNFTIITSGAGLLDPRIDVDVDAEDLPERDEILQSKCNNAIEVSQSVPGTCS